MKEIEQALETVTEVFTPELTSQLPAVETSKYLTQQQKTNIATIAYVVHQKGQTINADNIHKLWPVGGSKLTQQRAGERPDLVRIANWLSTDEAKEVLLQRGLPVDYDDIQGSDGLTERQIALISILSDTTTKMGIGMRLKRAGVQPAEFRAWLRQAAFADAYRDIVGQEMQHATKGVDTVLAGMAQNGDLNAIKYFNELMGRGPNDKKQVDAIAFSRVVLEAVMKFCTADQIKNISAEIELAAKQAGLEN